MEEGTIIAWLKDDGDTVSAGEEIVEIETDKATMAYAAEDSGALQIVAPEGATISVGAEIARIGEPKAAAVKTTAPGQNLNDGSAAGGAGADVDPAAGSSSNGASNIGGAGSVQGARVKASPLARRMATELGVALETVVGSGPNGRIVKADVLAQTVASPVGATASVVVLSASSPVFAEETTPAPVSKSFTAVGLATDEDTVEEFTRLQSTIANRMIRSRAEVPDFTVSIDVDAEPMSELRAQLKAEASDTRPAPSLNDMVVKAAALALRAHPRANASYTEQHVILHAHVNVGFAVAGQGALLVPVIADADLKSLGHISRESRALAERARSGQITPAELEGGTFTISNLGMFGALECIPVVNGGQAAILGVGAIRTEPVVADRALAIGLRMRLTIACDHRILYGADAAEFLDAIRSVLEHPLSLAL